jgi:hypothetical protein
MRKWFIRLLLGFALLLAALLACFLWLTHDCRDNLDPIRNSAGGARILRAAAQQWQAVNNETSCPSVSQLIASQQLDPGQSINDSWNHPYRLSCTSDEVIVRSAGSDGLFGTTDDVVVPRGSEP